MNTPAHELALVIPVYNEQACIAHVINQWHNQLEKLAINHTLIIINDGSTDGTAEALAPFATNPCIQLIHRPNGGHGTAIIQGYQQAHPIAQWIFQVDSDDEIPASQFDKIWPHRHTHDLVIGWRQARTQLPIHRKLLTLGARWITTGPRTTTAKDANAPFRLMRTTLLRDWLPTLPPAPFAPNTLMTLYANLKNLPTLSIPITHQPRRTGTASITSSDFLKLAYRCTREARDYRKQLHNQKNKKGKP